MRIPMPAVLAAIAFLGCSSGTHTVVVVRPTTPATTVRVPAPVVAPSAVPVALPALEVALGRPSAAKIVVQTNRPAYIAVFEITPQHGVILAHPSSVRQSTMLLSGISSIPVTWETQMVEQRVGATGRPLRAARYLYVLASDRPFRMTDAAFQPGYLERVLGPVTYRAAAPQPVTQALVRHFAPSASAGRWAEDMHAVAPAEKGTTYRIARIYCPGGTVFEVPENIADRAWCPAPATPQNPSGRGRGNGSSADESASSPDSAVGQDGRRVKRRMGSMGRGVGAPATVEPRPASPVATLPTPRATPDQRKPDPVVGQGSDRVEKERAEKERAEKERAEMERAEMERAEMERGEKERVEMERVEKERIEKERVEKERGEKERVEREKNYREQEEAADRLKREKSESDILASNKAEKEKLEKDNAEKIEKDKAEKDKADVTPDSTDKTDARSKRRPPHKAGPPSAPEP